MTKFEKSMLIGFATEFSFYLKAHHYHWNVEGPLFTTLHPFFGDIYNEVFDDIDNFAEQIRALKIKVPADLGAMSSLSRISDSSENLSSGEMVENLLQDSLKVSGILRSLIEMAGGEREYGVQDFLIKRAGAHRKHEWMLRSFLTE